MTDLCTPSENGGRRAQRADKNLGGACTLAWWTTLLAGLITLSDLQISVESWGNRSTWRFSCFQSDAEDSSQGQRGQRWWWWGGGFMLFWSVSATLTVMKSPRPRTCLDKHNSHWSKWIDYLICTGSINHYLASSWKLLSQLSGKQNLWNLLLSISSLRNDIERNGRDVGEFKCGIVFVLGPQNTASKC